MGVLGDNGESSESEGSEGGSDLHRSGPRSSGSRGGRGGSGSGGDGSGGSDRGSGGAGAGEIVSVTIEEQTRKVDSTHAAAGLLAVLTRTRSMMCTTPFLIGRNVLAMMMEIRNENRADLPDENVGSDDLSSHRTGGDEDTSRVGGERKGLSSGRRGHQIVGDEIRRYDGTNDKMVCEDGPKRSRIKSGGNTGDGSEGSLGGSEQSRSDSIVDGSSEVGGSHSANERGESGGSGGSADADGDAVVKKSQKVSLNLIIEEWGDVRENGRDDVDDEVSVGRRGNGGDVRQGLVDGNRSSVSAGENESLRLSSRKGDEGGVEDGSGDGGGAVEGGGGERSGEDVVENDLGDEGSVSGDVGGESSKGLRES